MRPIKFRLWDEKNQCFISVDDYRKLLSNCDIHPDSTFILQQYIGIEDKNSKEVYEGDIVKFFDRYNNIEIIGVVRYNKSCQYVVDHIFTEENKWKAGKKKGFAINTNCEVIGNNKENMDLLK